MEKSHPASERLLPTLPTSKFVEKPAEIDRFVVRIWPDGSLYFKGSHERIDEFLRHCADAGLTVHVDHISLCG